MKDLLFRAIVGLAGTLLLYRGEGMVGLAYSAALWGLLMAKPILEGVSEATRWIRHGAQNRVGWDLYGVGMYELRIQDVAGQPWIAANELLAALDTNAGALENFDALEYDRIPDRAEWGLSEAGTRRLIEMINTDHARRLALKLEREVFAPRRKQRARSAPSAVKTS